MQWYKNAFLKDFVFGKMDRILGTIAGLRG